MGHSCTSHHRWHTYSAPAGGVVLSVWEFQRHGFSTFHNRQGLSGLQRPFDFQHALEKKTTNKLFYNTVYWLSSPVTCSDADLDVTCDCCWSHPVLHQQHLCSQRQHAFLSWSSQLQVHTFEASIFSPGMFSTRCFLICSNVTPQLPVSFLGRSCTLKPLARMNSAVIDTICGLNRFCLSTCSTNTFR